MQAVHEGNEQHMDGGQMDGMDPGDVDEVQEDGAPD
jgi:hypothetical protein